MATDYPLDWCMDVIYQGDLGRLDQGCQEACLGYEIPPVVIQKILDNPQQPPKPDRYDLIQDLAKRWRWNDHYGYPIPDERGRPKLNWLKCAHPACGHECNHPFALADHLIQKQAYTRGFHLAHENAIIETGLTSEQVHATNKVQCPSLICNIGTFQSSDALIDHLTRLGMPGFWQPGMTLEPLPDPALDLTITKLDKCIACGTQDPELLCIPCGHQIMCCDCFKPMTECLVCTTEIRNILLV